MQEVSQMGVGAVLRLERGGMVNGQRLRQATNEYASLPSPRTPPPAAVHCRARVPPVVDPYESVITDG